MWEAFSISIEPLDGITTVLGLNNQQLMSHLKSIGKSWATWITGHNTVVLNNLFPAQQGVNNWQHLTMQSRARKDFKALDN